jgi:hypothetical protein
MSALKDRRSIQKQMVDPNEERIIMTTYMDDFSKNHIADFRKNFSKSVSKTSKLLKSSLLFS